METDVLGILAPVANVLALALLLATVNKVLVDYLLAPVRKRWPELSLWWAVYVSLVTGFLIGWFADVNLFALWIDGDILGRILTSLLIGGGSSLIYDIFLRNKPGSA